MKPSTAWLAASTLTLTLFVFIPSELFFASPLEFPFLLGDYLGYAVAAALCATLLLAGSTRLTSGTAERQVALFASFATLLWVQSTFVPWRHGPLDGRQLAGWRQDPFAALDIVLWVVILVAPQFFASLRQPTLVRAVCVIALAAQGASFINEALSASDHARLEQYGIAAATRFDYSSKENVFLVILDEFQADVFPEVLARRPQLRDELRGFTFFRGALASAKQTFPAVPEMLTGRRYLNDTRVADYLRQAYSADSLLLRLTRLGYRIEIYPFTTDTIHLSPQWAANLVEPPPPGRQLLRLLDGGLFRGAPFLLKPAIYREGHWLISSLGSEGLSAASASPYFDKYSASLPAFRQGLRQARVSGEGKVFKLYHLAGMHIPLSFDENLQPSSKPYDRDSYRAQATGVMQVMALFFAKLEELGLYDDSLIVVVGDHGSGRTPDMWLGPQDLSRADFNTDKARGCPLLLIKRPGEREELRTSNAQVSLLDLPVTILGSLGLPSDGLEGLSAFELPESGTRPRIYSAYGWEKFNAEYLPPITEYLVEGDAWDDRSWRVGQVHSAPPS